MYILHLMSQMATKIYKIHNLFFIFSFKIYVLMQQKTLISRTSRPNTYDSPEEVNCWNHIPPKYQNFQITKLTLFKLIKGKVNKKLPHKYFVYVFNIFHCLGSDAVNLTHLLFIATAWVQFNSSSSHLI